MDYPKFIVSNQKEESSSIQMIIHPCPGIQWDSIHHIRSEPFFFNSLCKRQDIGDMFLEQYSYWNYPKLKFVCAFSESAGGQFYMLCIKIMELEMVYLEDSR